MTVDTNQLRAVGLVVGELAVRAVSNVDHAVARDGRAQLYGAADEIDRLTDLVGQLEQSLAAIPHAPLCQLLMLRDDEACSCAKSVLPVPDGPPLVIPDATTVTYLPARRLTVAGPHGTVLGLPRVSGVRVDLDADHLTVSYTNPERNT